ncbi:MAG: hypothetical protein DWQ34_10835 [Planctomycetota bacterium]|nr:MAG: hypothetical protein DWQ29_04855 [Planctomycetota bacterium]REJ93401.1 MAG: hypothetical protein DWQ34_10835 [Planctomycetota bacterium]REK20778.1 MAG: hypothetical protein DWQ41_24355 [Planctomycetota bacterium]REK38040.1 MAG: hypothetical protein DWQ45_05195 [Planctomycetota bacterium]
MTIKKNIAASWAAHVVTLLVGFFLVPYVLGRIGEEGYGVWVFLNSVAGYSGLLYLGFGPTVCRFVTQHRAKGEWAAINHVVNSVSAVYAAAGTVVLLLAGGFAAVSPLLDKWGETPIFEVQAAVLVLGLNLAVGMVFSVYGGVLLAAKRFDLYSFVQGVTALVRLGLTIVFLQQQYGLVILAGIFLAVTVLENLLTAWLAFREFPTLSIGPRWIRRDVLKECFGFSAYNALRGLSDQMIHFTDTIVIGLVLGAKAIVPYYIGARLVQMVHTPLEKIGDVVLPAAGECHARNEQRRLVELLMKGMSLVMLLAAGFWIGAAFFGDQVVLAWMGETYAESHLVMLILLAGQIASQPMTVVRQVLMATGNVRGPALFGMIEAAGNLLLSLVLIHVMGIVGVAWGTLIPMLLVEFGLLLPFAMKHLDLRLPQLIHSVLAPLCLPLAMLWVYCEVVSRYASPAGWGAIVPVTIGGGAVVGTVWYAVEILKRFELQRGRIDTTYPNTEATA